MKSLTKISACALLAAGVATSTYGQVQTAGTLLVDVDATTQPVGVFTSLNNNGTLGGVFIANNSAVAGVSNLIVALGGNGTRGVLLDGNQNSLRHYTTTAGTTIVNPPAGLTGSNPDFSVEVWMYKATINDETGPVAWGNRSVSGANVSCNWGRNAGWGGFSWQGTGFDHSWANVPTAGSWHHLTWTYDAIATGTGVGTVRLYRDGVLDKFEVQTNAPNISATNNIWLGLQHSGSGTFGFAAGVLAKVRIHDGVLTPAQILNNYNFEAGFFTNGTPATVLATPPIHRYSFNLPPTNNAIGLTVPDTGTANGAAAIIRGNSLAAPAAFPYFDGAQLVLPSYGGNTAATNGYVDLPNGILSSLSSSNGGPGAVSLELWVEVTAAATWAEMLYMGSAANGEINGTGTLSTGGANGIVIPGQINTSAEQSGFRSGSIGNYTISTRFIGSRKHVVVTWDELSNLVKIYHEGIQVGQFVVTGKMNSIADVNNWLGRSGWNDADLPANYREFRMYNRLLSPAEIRRNYLAGPADVSDASLLTWDGTTDGNWDTSTYNWLSSGVSTNFANGNAVLFNDTATGTTSVTNNATLTPKSVTFENSTKNYTLSGSGDLSGTASLTKNGNGTLTFTGPQANDYTGPNLLMAGKVMLSNLANGGSPSALGASSSDATNLVLNGATLSYQGAAVTINRGYYAVDVPSTIEVQNGLNISGVVKAAGLSGLVKSGPGTLTYSTVGSNLLASGALPGLNVAQGKVVFDGANNTNRIMSEVWIGGNTNNAVNLAISNATLLADSWVGVGRGNGSIGNASILTLQNGHVWVAANGISLGYNGGLANNLANPSMTLNGTSTVFMPGYQYVGESAGSSGTLNLNDTSWLRSTRLLVGVSGGSTGAVYIANSSAFTNASGGYTSIGTGSGAAAGAGGVGLFVVKDNGAYYSSGDFNVTDLANSVGEADIMNNATVTTGAGYIGKSAGCVGVLNISGGSLTAAGQNFQIGVSGQGTLNQSGGIVTVGAFPSIGRNATGVGLLNISAGTFNQTNAGTFLIVGESGSGELDVSGSGQVNAVRMSIGNTTGASGTVNLNGGTISTRQVLMNNFAASSYFYFNGGVLQAAAGASNNFMSGLTAAFVYAGGANIDSAGNNIAITQDLNTDYTGGGLTKQGTGSLTLSGYLYYVGPTTVANGTLNLTTHDYSGGSISVADGAALGVQVLDYNGAQTSASSLTVGSATGAALTFTLGSFGNPTAAPLSVSGGTVNLNGAVTINVDPNSSLSVGEIPLVSYNSQTGSGTLTLGTLPPGVFGYLTNDTSNLPNFIGLVVTSVFQPRWEGLAGGNWDIQVTTNWIDRITGLPQYFYQGTTAVFDDEALGTTSVNLVTTVNPGGVLVTNSSLPYTIGGVGHISGGSGLTKLGNGTLTLSTTNNNYTGDTVIDEGGTLVSTVANNLGTNSALNIGTGTLSLGANNQKFSTVAVTNGTIAASTATIAAGAYYLDNGSVNALLTGGTLTTFGTNVADLVSIIGGNTYTGRTYLVGSTLAVTSLANGGLPSSIGISSASPTNLVFAGGGLSYSGPAVTIDRGYTVESGGQLTANANLTLAGPITATGGAFSKSGNATVTYTALGTNVLTRGGGAGAYSANAGTVILNGGAGAPGSYLQTNIITGELWVGSDQVNAGAVIVTNSSLAISSWLAIDRGNGMLGSQSVVSLYDSVATIGNCSMGYDNAIIGNWERPVLNLNGTSRLNDAGALYVGESIGSDAKVFMNNTSLVQVTGSALIGRNAGSTGAVQVANSSSLIVNGGSSWFSIGSSGEGSATFMNNALILNSRDENVGDVTGSRGTLNLQDNATNTTANFYVGKSGTATGVLNQSGGYLGRLNPAPLIAYADWRVGGNTTADATAVGTINLSGGVFEPFSNFQVGAYGIGYWNQTGGIANCANYPSMGRYPGSTGTLNVSGGVFNQTGSGQLLIIGEQGTATLTVTNSGLVNCVGGLSIGHTATGNGIVNLDGGTITTRIVQSPGATLGGSGTLNLNGGLLQANANNATFMSGLTAAYVLAGGAIIDSSSNAITVDQALLDGGTGGGLTKLGSGSLILGGINTYLGATTVSNGTLRINGSIPGTVDAKAGSTLGGTGTLGGSVVAEAGSTLSPGASVGTLTVNGNLTIAGNLFIEVDKTLSPSNDLTVVTGTLNNTGTGTVTVTNLGATALASGDTFKLFSQPLLGGNALTILGQPGAGLGWTNHLALDGTIGVVTTVAMNPTNISYSLSGNTLTISWPTDHTGWTLQSQTNSLATGLGNNWVDVAGSATGNTSLFTVDPNTPTVFFRLRSP